MNLNTVDEFTWHGKVNELPVTDVIIKYVEHMASRQTTKGLNIQNREKVIYHPTIWIEGAEYK